MMGPAVYYKVVPPGRKIAERVLGMRSTRRGRLVQACMQAWQERHKGIRHGQLMEIPPQSSARKTSVCYFVGKCVCSCPVGRSLCLIVESFQKATRQILAKGCLARAAYDKSLVVLRLHCPEEQYAESLWLHLGHGNLQKHMFSMSVLKYIETQDDKVVLQAEAENSRLRSMNQWKCIALKLNSQNYKLPLDLDLFVLDHRPGPPVTGEFLPQMVTVTSMDPPVSCQMFRPGSDWGKW